MKNINLLFGAIILITLFSCSKEERSCNFSASITNNETKTILNTDCLSFSGDETCGVIVKETGGQTIINQFAIANSKSEINTFLGQFYPTGLKPRIVEYYSYYPYSCIRDGYSIKSSLSSSQSGPFDSKSIYLCANRTAEYDETKDITTSFQFNSIFPIIRIAFQNDISEYENDIVRSVIFSSDLPIAGDFTYNLLSPESVSFSNGVNYVISQFDKLSLSVSTGFSTNLVIGCNQDQNITIQIETDKRTLVFQSSGKICFNNSKINKIELLASKANQTKTYKTVACFGDSFTDRGKPIECNYPFQLQALLGNDWRVSNYGYSGANSTYVKYIVQKWRNYNANADLVVIYCGVNDGYYSDYYTLYDRYNELISLLHNPEDFILMGQHTRQFWGDPVYVSSDPLSIIDKRTDDNGVSYKQAIADPFSSQNRFIDLYNPIVSNWKYWLVRTGKYTNESEISIANEFPGSGTTSDGPVYRDEKAIDWPISFWYGNNELERKCVHPNVFGAKAIAILIEEKMDELGYTD